MGEQPRNLVVQSPRRRFVGSTTTKGRARRYLSSVPFVTVHLACALALVYPPTWHLALLAVGSYLLRMWAVTVGYHRYLSHRSFRTNRALQFVLALLGATAMQQGPLWWASWHRRHHEYADTPDDPHSPVVRHFWHAHVGWVFDGTHDDPDLSNVQDLPRFSELRFLDRHSWLPLVAYATGCFAIAGMPGIVWGFAVSTIAVVHATFLINSVAHVWGFRRYDTADRSRNNPVLALLTLGEGWHNNHHHYMTSARQGFFWWEVDASYYSILLLAGLRLVWNVRVPSPQVLSMHRSVQGRDTNSLGSLRWRKRRPPGNPVPEKRVGGTQRQRRPSLRASHSEMMSVP